MNKEKILESSRRENKNRDLAEMEVTAQAGNETLPDVSVLRSALFSLLSFVSSQKRTF